MERHTIKVSRNEVIVLVDDAARKAQVEPEAHERLLEAAKDERNTLFMVGFYQDRELPDCKCPANHAGYVYIVDDKAVEGFPYYFDTLDIVDDEYRTHSKAVEGFPYYFDTLVRQRLHARWAILVVVND
jgi:hypothetical protein